MNTYNNLAIVGSSKADLSAIKHIEDIFDEIQPNIFISGGAKGIDYLSEMVADKLDIPTVIYTPETKDWEGYKARNILIAKNCDILYNLVLRSTDSYCYHHNERGHIKSGGCWTQMYANNLGKRTRCIIIG